MMDDKLKKATEASIKAMQEFTKVAEQIGAACSTPQWVPEVGDSVRTRDKINPREHVVIAISGDMAWIKLAYQKQRGQLYPLEQLTPWLSEEDRAVEEMARVLSDNYADVVELVRPLSEFIGPAKALYQHGYRKQPQPAEDVSDKAEVHYKGAKISKDESALFEKMRKDKAALNLDDPANWRAGDLLFCYKSNTTSVYTPGNVYPFKGWTGDGKLDVADNLGGESSCHIFPDDSTLSFRFHTRP